MTSRLIRFADQYTSEAFAGVTNRGPSRWKHDARDLSHLGARRADDCRVVHLAPARRRDRHPAARCAGPGPDHGVAPPAGRCRPGRRVAAAVLALAPQRPACRRPLRRRPGRDERLLLRRARPHPARHGGHHRVHRTAGARGGALPALARPDLGAARGRRDRRPGARGRSGRIGAARSAGGGVRPGRRRILGALHPRGQEGGGDRGRPGTARAGHRGRRRRHGAVRGGVRGHSGGAAGTAPPAGGGRPAVLAHSVLARVRSPAPADAARLRCAAEPRTGDRRPRRLGAPRPGHDLDRGGGDGRRGGGVDRVDGVRGSADAPGRLAVDRLKAGRRP